MVFETEEEKFAIGYIKNVVRYLEPFEEGFYRRNEK